MSILKPVRYLANLGYGTRREVTRLFAEGRVTHRDGRLLRDSEPAEHYDLFVDGEPLDPPPGVVIMLHKPVGYVCSTAGPDRLIYELLPPRFLARSPVIAPVGRLDRDTSGLLLLTDDGQLNHRLTSPRSHFSKVYEAQLASPLRGDEPAVFAAGTLLLDGEAAPLRPATLGIIDEKHARVTLTEGRYHQVRRMFAAVGNRVEALCRIAVGPLTLDGLEPGTWRVLGDDEISRLRRAPPATSLP